MFSSYKITYKTENGKFSSYKEDCNVAVVIMLQLRRLLKRKIVMLQQ